MTKSEKYESFIIDAKNLIDPACCWVGNFSNIVALLQQNFGHWWTGFYIVRNNELVLGPFQGPVACTRIALGKGVCGSSWQQKQSIVVPDVHLFPGHIACSAASNSEIVIPLIINSEVIAVLDIDSIHYNTFDETDRLYLEKLAFVLANLYAAE